MKILLSQLILLPAVLGIISGSPILALGSCIYIVAIMRCRAIRKVLIKGLRDYETRLHI